MGPECQHALWLLPVIDFNLTFTCTRCGGTVVCGPGGDLVRAGGAATSFDSYVLFVVGIVGGILGTECTYAGATEAEVDNQEFLERSGIAAVARENGLELFPEEEGDDDGGTEQPD